MVYTNRLCASAPSSPCICPFLSLRLSLLVHASVPSCSCVCLSVYVCLLSILFECLLSHPCLSVNLLGGHPFMTSTRRGEGVKRGGPLGGGGGGGVQPHVDVHIEN